MSQQTQVYATGGTATYTAPSTLLNGSVVVTANGAPGAGGTGGASGGAGARVTGTIIIAAGGTLTVNVGDPSGNGIHAGGTAPDGTAGHGGGSSGVLSGSTVLIEAGGGGGAGGYQSNDGNTGGAGGAGGATTGNGASGNNISYGENYGTGGLGGSQGGGGGTGGAFDGVAGSAQSAGTGGTGAPSETASSPGGAGGGGGGGGHVGGGGGGGGGANAAGGGGGGGTSYVDATVSAPSFADGASTGYGAVDITATVADPPLTPTLTSPAAGAYLDAAAVGVTFDWTYNPGTDSGSQQAYTLRVSVDGAAYQYWNATSGALQSAQVWNTSAASTVNIPAGILSDGHTVAWSVQTQESHYGLQGPFASDSSFQTTSMPTVTVTAPTGSVSSATPLVQWTETLGSGDAQTAFRVVVYPKTVTEQAGFAPGSTTPTVDSGTVSSAALSWTVSSAIGQGDWVVYVQVTETGGVTSQWTAGPFTVAFDPPAAPTVTAATGTSAQGVPTVSVTVTTHDNLVSYSDSSFENGVGTWTPGVNCTVAQSSAAAEDGTYSLAITATAAGDMASSTSATTYAVTGGVTYTAIESFKAASTGRSVHVGINWYDSSGTFISTAAGTPATDTTTGWTQVVVSATAPATAAYAQLSANIASAASSEVHYLDEVGLYSSATAPSWSRGGLLGSQLVTVERSVDGGATWAPVRDAVLVSVPTNTEQVTVVDSEAPFNTACTYQATVSANVSTPVPGTITSTAVTVTATTGAEKWMLTDPLDTTVALALSRVSALSGNAAVQARVSFETDSLEQMGVFYGFGNSLPIVQRGTMQAKTFTVNAYIEGYDDYATWQKLTGRDGTVPPRQHTLQLRSDMGDSWYVVVGPALADMLLRSSDRVTAPKWVVEIPCIVTAAP